MPGASASDEIRNIAAGIRLPVNVLAHPTVTVAELGQLGVRRVSSGSLPYRSAVDASVNVVASLCDGEQVATATSYGDMQSRLVTFSQGIAG